jgi:hypothetical protein
MKEQLRFSFDSESAETSSNDQSDHPSPTPSHVRKDYDKALKEWKTNLKNPDFLVECIEYLFQKFEQKVINFLFNLIKKRRKPIEGILNIIKMHLWKFPLDLDKMLNSPHSDFNAAFKKKDSFGTRWMYKWIEKASDETPIPCEEYDPGPEYSLQERAVEIYNKKEELQEAHKEKVRHRLNDMTYILHGAFEKSKGQSKKSRAGNSIEYIVNELVLNALADECPQFKHSRNIQQKDRSVDFVIENTELNIKLNLSCKHTMRDRVADKHDHIQVVWTDEMATATLEFFAENGNLVIIGDETCRKDAINKLKKLNINLRICDLVEGKEEIKKLLSL